MTTRDSPGTPTRSGAPLLQRTMAAGAISAAANFALYLLFHSAFTELARSAPAGALHITAGAVLVTSLLGAGLAGIAAWLLRRLGKPRGWLFWPGLVILVLSMAGPLGLTGAPRSVIASLMAMHIVTAGTAWWLLRPLWTSEERG